MNAPHSPRNPQSGSSADKLPQDISPLGASSLHSVTTTATASPVSPSKKRRDLPPLFWYMELGDWDKAKSRAKSHPKEVKTRATLRTKSMANSSEGGDASTSSTSKVSGTKRLALHHACFKLRSAGSAPIPQRKEDQDPFLAVCQCILLLIELFPEACQIRESKHGCYPLHLAAFASCYVRPPSSEDDEAELLVTRKSSSSSSSYSPKQQHQQQQQQQHQQQQQQLQKSQSHGSNNNSNKPHYTGASVRNKTNNNTSNRLSPIPKPHMLRSSSESTASSNMTAILMEENFAAAQTFRKKEGYAPPPLTTTTTSASHSASSPEAAKTPTTKTQTIFISNKREQMAVKVLNAMLDAYPRAIRLDSEGGRLPLHTACAGRATPRCVSMLLRAYPAAARHRNKDGFLPLHLCAHWGVSHPNVAITLLKAYPDATVGRNRWERTPLEEALVMAGENGRPHQAPLVRALRKHPSYWTRPPQELFQAMNMSPNNQESHVVDMDATLASGENESSTDDNPNYFNMGHSILLEDEYENVPEGEETFDNKGGIISRLRRKNHKAENVDISQDLPSLIKNLRWKSVIARLEINPDEANHELIGVMTRGGFQASAGMTPLHYACERKPPIEVIEALMEANPEAVSQRMMPGGALPLHVACTWHAAPLVISALLSADPTTAKVVDELGNRALHTAAFSGTSLAIVQDLLVAYPKAVLSRNNQGSQPIDISRRLRHPNRRVVMQALLEKKDCVVQQQNNHRRSKSSGSMTGLAQQAATLNATYGAPAPGNKIPSFEQVVEEEEDKKDCLAEVGVEVTYGQDKQLLWI